MTWLRHTALLLALLGPLACSSAFFWASMPFVYEEAPLPTEQVLRDLPYRDGSGADARKHRLDLFLPRAETGSEARAWPVLVFVHGGGWTSGDKGLRVGGADVYGNIGRFFAARGIGVAVVSYRLQPRVTWREQVEDVTRAVEWVRAHVAEYGGDPRAVFVSGHSSGAQLAAHVVLDPARLDGAGVCGLIPVSGAALDLTDDETWALGADRSYYEERFGDGEPDDAWLREASPARFARADAPPTLVLYAGGEWPELQRQAEVFHRALVEAGAHSRLVQVPGLDHYRMILALSRDDWAAAPVILAFLRDIDCAGDS